MFVVYNFITGWSDESMRFGTREEAEQYIEDSIAGPDLLIREED